jgi:hypothetical protein
MFEMSALPFGLGVEQLSEMLDTTVVSARVEVVGADAGVLGELARLRLVYADGESGPASLIVKVPTSAPANRDVGMAFRFYEREWRFYVELADRVGLRVPRVHHASGDPASGEFMLVLEDLEDLSQRSQTVGLSGPDAETAIDALAAMHARWWCEPSLAAATWLPRIDGAGEREQTAALYEDGWSEFVARFRPLLTPQMLQAGELIRHQFLHVIDHLGCEPLTLTHGDFRVDNLFFDDEASPTSLTVIDWQIAMLSRGPFDVAYLLGTSMTSDRRRASEAALVSRYHGALVGLGIEEYSLAQCWDDYRWGLMYGSVYPIDAGSFDLPSAAAEAMVGEWAGRFFAAIVDLDCASLVGGRSG